MSTIIRTHLKCGTSESKTIQDVLFFTKVWSKEAYCLVLNELYFPTTFSHYGPGKYITDGLLLSDIFSYTLGYDIFPIEFTASFFATDSSEERKQNSETQNNRLHVIKQLWFWAAKCEVTTLMRSCPGYSSCHWFLSPRNRCSLRTWVGHTPLEEVSAQVDISTPEMLQFQDKDQFIPRAPLVLSRGDTSAVHQAIRVCQIGSDCVQLQTSFSPWILKLLGGAHWAENAENSWQDQLSQLLLPKDNTFIRTDQTQINLG